LVLGLAAALALGCGSSGTHGYADLPSDSEPGELRFSDLELASLRDDFGDLPRSAPADPSNAFASEPLAAKLGQKLFFDPRVSSTHGVSCATCHIPEAGFQDNRDNTSQGLDFTSRHAPSVLNSAYGAGAGEPATWQFWDGRKDSLWAQALGPPESSVEMGGARSRVALLIYDKYRVEYEAAFPPYSPMPRLRDVATGEPLVSEDAGPHGSEQGQSAWSELGLGNPKLQADITRVFVNFGKALAAYQSLLVSRGSRFDQFRGALLEGFADNGHLSANEIEGLRLFIGKAACASCHRGPNLSDGKFHNIAVPQTAPHVAAVDQGRADGMTTVASDEFNCQSQWSDQSEPLQCSIAALDQSAEELQAAVGAFKTPTLRSVSMTAPYFHTGGSATLADVIELYTRGGAESGYSGERDANIAPLELSAEEQQRLIDFLGALDGEALPRELIEAPILPD
jgi:cytochrome c peroxidase